MWWRALWLMLLAGLPGQILAFDAHVLDPSFGALGKRTVSFDLGDARTDRVVGAFAAIDGTTVIVGQVSIAGGTRVGLARLLSDGTLDTSFGTGGKRVLDLCMSRVGGVTYLLGQFLIFGETTECSTDGTRDLRIARLQADASLDASFGSQGVVSTSFKANADDSLHAIHRHSDGRLMLLGGAVAQGESIERPAGKIVPSNGVGTLAGFSDAYSGFAEPARFVSVLSAGSNVYLLIQRDGSTLATSGGIVRMTSQLVLSQDIPFSGSGTDIVECAQGAPYRPRALVQVNSHIYAVGNRQVPTNEIFYSSILVTDNTLGRRTECFGTTRMLVNGATFDTAFASGQAWLAGTCPESIPGGSTAAMCVARLRSNTPNTPQLALDTSFNPDGGLPVNVSFTAATGQTPAAAGATALRRVAGRTQIVGTRRWNGADEDYAIAQLGAPALLRNGFE